MLKMGSKCWQAAGEMRQERGMNSMVGRMGMGHCLGGSCETGNGRHEAGVCEIRSA